QADGKIVVVGRAETASSTDIVVARYNPDGTLDASFDGDGSPGNGVVKTTVADGGEANAVAIQPDGKIVVVGVAEFNSPSVHNEFVVLRYNGSDGTLDTNFDGDGTPGNGI